MGVVGFPGGEEHREAWHEGGEGASFCMTETHGGGLAEASKGAVERVDAMAVSCLDVADTHEGVTYSNSSPKPLEVPVRRACLPSMLSMVEYLR